MAIQYSWDVNNVDVHPTLNSNVNVVHNVHWRLTGTDDANNDSNGDALTVTIYGTESLDTSDLSSFIVFDSVNATTVQGWVETAMGTNKIQVNKDIIDGRIALLVTPTSVTKTLTS